MPPLWAKPDSFIAIRAPFAKHNLWTIPYNDDHRYPAGMYVPQTQVTPEDSIEKWVGDGKAEIANKDIVSYLTFGTSVSRCLKALFASAPKMWRPAFLSTF